MNLKLGLLVAVAAAVILGGIGFAVNKLVLKPEVTPEAISSKSKPWIEVVAPGVFELAEDQKTEKKELFTGDELENGTAVGVRKDALANIYFSDGSVARLDSETRLVVESGDFNETSGKLAVRLNLLWGRVWSKVITVLTPESAWEVKTTNAVAVVRGTAFGVEYVEEGKSSVVGYENKVEVKLIDPETQKVLPIAALIVEPKKILEVKKEAIENIKAQLAVGELRQGQGAAAVATPAGKPLIEIKEASEKVLNQDWIKRGIEADKKLKDRREATKGKIEDRQEAIKPTMENKVLETREEFLPKATPPPAEKTSEIPTAVPAVAPAAVKPIPELNSAAATAVQVKSLAIKANRDLGLIVEGDSAVFRVFAQFSDGSEKEVTLEAVWKVLGRIGFMKSPGVFVAKLDPEISELGAGSGAVAAVWKDPKTGTAFEAASPIFKVEPEVDLNFDPTRG